MRKIRVAWHWFTMGPYHFARMTAVANQPGIELTVIETSSKDDHGWHREKAELPFRLISLSDHYKSEEIHYTTRADYGRALASVRPDIVVESGYAEPFSRQSALQYRLSNPSSRLILWSESTAVDNPRVWHREAVKRIVIKAFDGAIAAGPPHAEYLRTLGMPPERISIVGNCVDNEFFRRHADIARQKGRGTLPGRYFLFVGRLIGVKNIPFLLDAFSRYRQSTSGVPAELLLVGSGILEEELRAKVRRENIEGVQFVGNKQLEDLPAYYAHAISLILPSTSEPWGLVANEALASGTPVIMSNRCGCLDTLLVEGQSGFSFDPCDQMQLATLLERMANTHLPITGVRNAVSTCDPLPYAESVAAHIRDVVNSPRLGFDGIRRFASLLVTSLDGSRHRITRA